MNRALLKLILGIAVALGLTLTAAPVATAAPSATPERAVDCVAQAKAVDVATITRSAARIKIQELKAKAIKLQRKIKRAKKHHQTAKAKRLTKKLNKVNRDIRRTKVLRANAAKAVSGTTVLLAACQAGSGTALPSGKPDKDNLLDYVGDALDALGIGFLLDSLGLEAVLDLLDQTGLLDLLGLGDLRP
jgi:TolA-binding protein